MSPAGSRVSFEAIVDYAGLFPPASLGMGEAVANYDAYRRRADAWMLGRFVVTAPRLSEFVSAWRSVAVGASWGPESRPSEAWRVSTLLGAPVGKDLDLVDTARANAQGGLVFDSFEIKGDTPDAVREATLLIHARAGTDALVFVEVPLGARLEDRLAAVRAVGAFAKIRMGGVTAGAIPTPRAAAEFIAACAELGLSFKATAGLHHPVRGEYALTYAADSDRATMHGFLNVWHAAAKALAGASRDAIVAALESPSPESSLGNVSLRKFALSFGSCSFTEPVDGLKELGWVPRGVSR
jgi:hypothetical protein